MEKPTRNTQEPTREQTLEHDDELGLDALEQVSGGGLLLPAVQKVREAAYRD